MRIIYLIGVMVAVFHLLFVGVLAPFLIPVYLTSVAASIAGFKSLEH